MGLLKEATNEQSAAKIGFFGFQGSGKTATAGMLAIGMSKSYHSGAPVAMHDTENGSDYLIPIFKAEGIKLLVHKSKAFADMTRVLDEAEKGQCCAFIEDSVSHTWAELMDSFRKKRRIERIEFQHWGIIKPMWNEWTDRYLNSPLHCIVNGRAGYEYEYQENQEGKKELIKGDTKMRAEGQFGYEPSLLIEMEGVRDTAGERVGGRFIHRAHVLKDRTWALNGKQFDFADRDGYKAGDWKKVFDAFKPHLDFLRIGGKQVALEPGSSEALFTKDGDSEYYAQQKQKKIALEELENTMVLLWPGTDQKSKRVKLLVLENLYGVRSWQAVENMPIANIEGGLRILRTFEMHAKEREVTTEEQIIELLKESLTAVAEADAAASEGGKLVKEDEEVPF